MYSVHSLFSATIPPKAESLSASIALTKAVSILLLIAPPHGLACFITTHAGSSNSVIHDTAASASIILL